MSNQRSLLLDIFRIILCIGVVVYHYTPERPSSGPFMVNGFLVLSGFLIGLAFRLKSEFDVVRFYANKGKRLLPMMLIALLMGVIGRWYLNEAVPNWSSGEWGEFSLVKWLMYYNTPLWYMGVELSLLLMVPVLYCLYKTKWGMLVFLLIGSLGSCYLFSQVAECAPFAEGLYFSPVARCWQFVVGCMAAGMCDKLRLWRSRSISCYKKMMLGLFFLFIISSVLLSIVKQGTTLHYWNYSFTFDLVTTLFYFILIPVLYVEEITLGEKCKSMLSYSAALTYPVFLIHVPLLAIAEQVMEFFLGGGAVWGCSVLAGIGTVAGSMILLKLEKKLIG